jgi:hypothetical protein
MLTHREFLKLAANGMQGQNDQPHQIEHRLLRQYLEIRAQIGLRQPSPRGLPSLAM